MSGGEQQMLAIGRALMGKPKVLLLDEPSMGISPVLTERIYETIEQINKEGMTILLVEQNANFALDVSKRAYVLETGKVAHVGHARTRCGPTPKSRRRTWEHDRARAHGSQRALAHVPVARVVHHRGLPLQPEGLRRQGRASRPACACRRSPIIVWLVWPAKPESKWKVVGPFGSRQGRRQVDAPSAAPDDPTCCGPRALSARPAAAGAARCRRPCSGSAGPRGMSQRTAAPAGSIASLKKSGWSAGPEVASGVIDANTQNAATAQPTSRRRRVRRLVASRDGTLGGVRQRVAQAVEVRREIAHASPPMMAARREVMSSSVLRFGALQPTAAAAPRPDRRAGYV